MPKTAFLLTYPHCLHAIKSALHHKYIYVYTYFKDIALQTLLPFAVTCSGIVHITGDFKDTGITPELKNKIGHIKELPNPLCI